MPNKVAKTEETDNRQGRWSRLALGAAAVIMVVGTVIAVIVAIGPVTTENFSSAGDTGRVQIPGNSSVTLEAQQYSLWYGIYTSGGIWAGTPTMTITVHPPAGASQPSFSWNDDDAQVDAVGKDNLTLELVAYVQPSVAGRYTISVTSQDGSAGVILIGKTLPSPPPAVIPALFVVVGSAVVAGVVLLATKRRRRS